jgi:hypothetical protein
MKAYMALFTMSFSLHIASSKTGLELHMAINPTGLSWER